MEQRLNGGDEHLILATQALWDVVSPDDAALRLHFHLKVKLLRKWIRLDQQCCLSCIRTSLILPCASDASVTLLIMCDYLCPAQANANQDLPVVAIQCDAVSSPLQAGMPQPAAAATNYGGDISKANAAESLVLYAMQRVAVKATRCATLCTLPCLLRPATISQLCVHSSHGSLTCMSC